jgi:hypothetical protein
MIQKDYLLRLIEQLGKFLAKAKAFKNTNKPEDALQAIETASSTLLGIDTPLLEALSVQDIGVFFGISKDSISGGLKCIIAARLLRGKIDLHLYTAADKTAPSSRLLKILKLYLNGILAVGRSELDLSSYHTDADRIAEHLGDLLHPDMMFKVFKMHLLLNNQDKAGKWLRKSKAAQFHAMQDSSDIFQ